MMKAATLVAALLLKRPQGLEHAKASLVWLSKPKRYGFLACGPTIYILIVLAGALATYAYKVRVNGIFSCQANGYSSDRYLDYCQAGNYADYEHGAFWFNLEPLAENFAKSAGVMFLGDSRLQLGFSTSATAQWFSSASARYYLLGFGYGGNVAFAEELLHKLKPQAKVYVITVDFFERSETPPAKEVMHDPTAPYRYKVKRLWQLAHEPLCKRLPVLCGNHYVVFRSRETGAYHVSEFNKFKSGPVAYDHVTNLEIVKKYEASAMDFLSHLSVTKECIILTMVPTVEANVETAHAVAKSLGIELVAPELGGLQTADGSHLDFSSAERWSQAFFEAAGPQIRKCLDKPSRS
jgi:hypothetical protein